MNVLDVRLLVGLRGPDLAASTALLTLIHKMGYGDRLVGLQRFDFFHLSVETPAPAESTFEALKATLARQSTFYNRNKHMYSLECRGKGATLADGVAHAELVKRFGQALGKRLARQTGIDFDGSGQRKVDIVNESPAFLVEVTVQDDDAAGRGAIASRLSRELSASVGQGTVKVQCPIRATVWWLAVRASDEAQAMETARQIVVTRRRDEGLLMNPNYQTAGFVAAGRVDSVPS